MPEIGDTVKKDFNGSLYEGTVEEDLGDGYYLVWFHSIPPGEEDNEVILASWEM